MTARISLICHGSTAGNRLSAFPADEPLEAKAMERTLQLKPALKRADRVLVAPSLRTRQTAEILEVRSMVDPALRECDYGRWTGIPIAAVGEQEAENLMLWMGDLDSSPHGGEPLSAVMLRASGWLERNMEASGHTILVTHASFIRACLLHILHAPASAFWKIDIEPLSITELGTDGRRWTLRQTASI